MGDWLDSELTDDEERAVRAFMSRVASTTPGHDALPGHERRAVALSDATALWHKSQLLRRWDAERRVQAPLDAMESVQIAAGLITAALLLVWSLPSLVRILSFIRV